MLFLKLFRCLLWRVGVSLVIFSAYFMIFALCALMVPCGDFLIRVSLFSFSVFVVLLLFILICFGLLGSKGKVFH